MSTPREHTVTSEIAYDLMQDHLETILALRDRPMGERELIERAGSEHAVRGLLKQGLVVREGEHFRASAERFHQLRQEGMMTFLQRYVLPTLTASLDLQGAEAARLQGAEAAREQGFATLTARDLVLTEQEISGLRAGTVQRLVDDVHAASEAPTAGPTSRFTLMIVGTTRVVEADDAARDDDSQRAMQHLQHACLQRSTPHERERAVLLQQDLLADRERYTRAMQAIEAFWGRWGRGRVEGPPTYHVMVATHWRSLGQSTADMRSGVGSELEPTEVLQ